MTSAGSECTVCIQASYSARGTNWDGERDWIAETFGRKGFYELLQPTKLVRSLAVLGELILPDPSSRSWLKLEAAA